MNNEIYAKHECDKKTFVNVTDLISKFSTMDTEIKNMSADTTSAVNKAVNYVRIAVVNNDDKYDAGMDEVTRKNIADNILKVCWQNLDATVYKTSILTKL